MTKITHITERPGYAPRTDSIYVALPGERYTPFSLAKKLGVEMPIVEAVYQMLFENRKVEDVVKEIWGRELKAENWA